MMQSSFSHTSHCCTMNFFLKLDYYKLIIFLAILQEQFYNMMKVSKGILTPYDTELSALRAPTIPLYHNIL